MRSLSGVQLRSTPMCARLHQTLAQYSLAVLAIQQPPVRVDLTLQPGLGVQQHLILLVLPLQVAADLSQLVLHVIDQTLYLGQLRAVLGLSLRHGAFQRFCLQKERECKEGGCRTISGARLPVFQPCSALIFPAM